MFMKSPPRVEGQGWLARAVVANRPKAVIFRLGWHWIPLCAPGQTRCRRRCAEVILVAPFGLVHRGGGLQAVAYRFLAALLLSKSASLPVSNRPRSNRVSLRLSVLGSFGQERRMWWLIFCGVLVILPIRHHSWPAHANYGFSYLTCTK